MKKSILISLLIIAASTQANADSRCELNLRIGGGMWHQMSEHQENKVRSLIERKGYIITENTNAPNKIHVSRGLGFVCGTGVTNYQATLQVPAGYSISFTGPGISFNKSEEFNGFAATVGQLAFEKLKAELRDIEPCEWEKL